MNLQKPRILESDRLVLATHSQGKMADFSSRFSDFSVTFLLASDLGLAVPDETGDSFLANALIKARAASEATGLPALADDSGIAVDGLNGDPGIYSADWADHSTDYPLAIQRIRKELDAINYPDSRTTFICLLCLVWPDGHYEYVEGKCHGHLVWDKRGDGGFGYDRYFIPEGKSQTFAELPPEERAALSARFQAIEAIKTKCFSR